MGILDIVFPKTCLGCKASGRYVCRECVGKVSHSNLICPRCDKPSIDGATHIRCKKPQGLDGLTSVWGYRGVVRKSLLGLKYKFAKEISEELADYITQYLKNEITALPKDAVSIPIPLHRRRKNWRGFNQVEVVGGLLAEKMGWRFESELLIRKVSKRPQTDLKREERRSNVRGVFSVDKKTHLPSTNYQSLILLDDVYTTGSTLKEACKVLKRNGAKKVWGLTIAR